MRSQIQNLGWGIFLTLYPGSGMEKFISGISISDPQHCAVAMRKGDIYWAWVDFYLQKQGELVKIGTILWGSFQTQIWIRQTIKFSRNPCCCFEGWPMRRVGCCVACFLWAPPEPSASRLTPWWSQPAPSQPSPLACSPTREQLFWLWKFWPICDRSDYFWPRNL